ncbi:MAG: hypothetical protein F6K16_40705 [Symploca sp. SIO2B6]|nr:hypothetical protein [Symploca sp. SIO2B6]
MTPLSIFRRKRSIAYFLYGLQLLVLAIGFGLVGWFLTAIHVHKVVWLSVYGLILYLVNVQQGGLFLAHGWVIVAIAFSAITRIWPSVWASHIPYEEPRLWAFILLLIWGVAIALIHLLALSPNPTRKFLRQLPFLSSPFISSSLTTAILLMGWVSMAIALGGLTYQIGLDSGGSL